MTRPIRIHLDTSDYIAMYAAAPGTQSANIRYQLRQLSEAGEIEIGLSYHVVFELLQQAEPKYRQDRLAAPGSSLNSAAETHSHIQVILDRDIVSRKTAYGSPASISKTWKSSASWAL
jgi:hypothetical protein